MDLQSIFRIQARANRLANHRLHGALTELSQADFHAPRVGFFPSLALTLNHILAVDAYYLAALHGDLAASAIWERFVPADDVGAWSERQRASDERLIAFCDGLGAEACDTVVAMDRGGGAFRRDRLGHVLSHVFMHQIHHRGQAHAMLSGTSAKPPQLDDFMLPSDARFRVEDMAALGWDEASVYGPALAP